MIWSVWYSPPPEFQQLSVIPVYPSAKLALHYNNTDPTRSNVSRRGGPWRRRYAHRIHFSWALECRPTKLSAPPHRFTPMRAPVSLLISHYTLSLDRDVPGGPHRGSIRGFFALPTSGEGFEFSSSASAASRGFSSVITRSRASTKPPESV